MVWYGMVWYGMVWYGMVWYGVAGLVAWRSYLSLYEELRDPGVAESSSGDNSMNEMNCADAAVPAELPFLDERRKRKQNASLLTANGALQGDDGGGGKTNKERSAAAGRPHPRSVRAGGPACVRHASQFPPWGILPSHFPASPPTTQVRRLWSQWPERGDACRCTEQTTLCQSC